MIAIFTNNYPFPNYGSLELPEQLSDRVISLLNSCLGFFTPLLLETVRLSKPLCESADSAIYP
jgi:hypothetical protein